MTKEQHIGKKIILYCAPINKPGNSGRYIIDGMEQLGFTVIGYDYRNNVNFETDLLTIIGKKRPDYFFTQKGEILRPEFIKTIKDKGLTTIFWCFDAAMEEAVRKSTSYPAQRMGLGDRGLLKEGYWADITIFDPDTVGAEGTFEQPELHPKGFEWVLVNGEVVLDSGVHTNALPGKVLRRA